MMPYRLGCSQAGDAQWRMRRKLRTNDDRRTTACHHAGPLGVGRRRNGVHRPRSPHSGRGHIRDASRWSTRSSPSLRRGQPGSGRARLPSGEGSPCANAQRTDGPLRSSSANRRDPLRSPVQTKKPRQDRCAVLRMGYGHRRGNGADRPRLRLAEILGRALPPVPRCLHPPLKSGRAIPFLWRWARKTLADMARVSDEKVRPSSIRTGGALNSITLSVRPSERPLAGTRPAGVSDPTSLGGRRSILVLYVQHATARAVPTVRRHLTHQALRLRVCTPSAGASPFSRSFGTRRVIRPPTGRATS
jgi:hypothetical protein